MTAGPVMALGLLLALVPAPGSGFIYFLGPMDIVNHFMCAVNASMSPVALRRIASNIRHVAEVTTNYTGDTSTLRSSLPDRIIDKMAECEAYHRACYDDSDEANSREDGGSQSAESLLTNFNPLHSMLDNETDPDCEPDYYIPLVVRCYKEADLMYFGSLAFSEEGDRNVEHYRECLESAFSGDEDVDK